MTGEVMKPWHPNNLNKFLFILFKNSSNCSLSCDYKRDQTWWYQNSIDLANCPI